MNTTVRQIVDTFHLTGKRRPCNRIAMIIAATLHDISNGRGADHHLGREAQAIARRTRDRILRQRRLGNDVTKIWLL